MEYIFKEDGKSLQFLGNFEEFYKDTNDPWDQSAVDKDSKMTKYYELSRSSLLSMLGELIKKHNLKRCSIAEFGCGLGYVTAQLKKQFPTFDFTGFDISDSAVQKANEIHSEYAQFLVSDIRINEKYLHGRFEIIMLVNMLWYILEDLEKVLENIGQYFDPNKDKSLIIQNAYFREEQRYGKEIIDGFLGARDYFLNAIKKRYKINHYSYHYHSDPSSQHDDGIIIINFT
jgi:SAM-dependent methyltransferase